MARDTDAREMRYRLLSSEYIKSLLCPSAEKLKMAEHTKSAAPQSFRSRPFRMTVRPMRLYGTRTNPLCEPPARFNFSAVFIIIPLVPLPRDFARAAACTLSPFSGIVLTTSPHRSASAFPGYGEILIDVDAVGSPPSGINSTLPVGS